jgi:hypothetical protein
LFQFLDSFPSRNSLGQDKMLADLVGKAREILTGCPDLKLLKDNGEWRERIRNGFTQIQEKIGEANMVQKKGRAIQLADEEK